MAAFPAYPMLLFDGFVEDPESAASRAPMETGPVKQLKTKSRVLVTRPLRYLINSNTDRNSFIAWHRDTVNLGADWFDWTDPVTATVKSARIVGGKIDWTPRRKQLDRWIVAFKLETWSA